MLFFSWIRRHTAQQVMLGFGDAARALAEDDGGDAPATVEELRALLASSAPKQLPAKAEDDDPEPVARRKK